MRTKDRHKAWIGAAIGAAASLAGSLIGGISSSNAQKKQQALQAIAQNRADTYQMAQNLTAGYGDQSYVNDLQKRVTFRCGGKKRKRAEEGGKFDYAGLISGISSGIGSATTGIMNANVIRNQHVGDSRESFANTPKTAIVMPDYIDRFQQMMRCGGKRRK